MPFSGIEIQLDSRSVSEGRCAGSRAVVVQFSIQDLFRKPQGNPHTGHLLEIQVQNIYCFGMDSSEKGLLEAEFTRYAAS